MSDQNIKYISLAEAAKLTNYSQDYISLLCRRGKMKGEKLGRNWFTTKEWIDDYINKTNGSGERVVPVRVKKAVKAELAENKEHGSVSDTLTKKLMFATVIFSALISGLVFLQQGVVGKHIAPTAKQVASNFQGLYLNEKANIGYQILSQKVVSLSNSLDVIENESTKFATNAATGLSPIATMREGVISLSDSLNLIKDESTGFASSKIIGAGNSLNIISDHGRDAVSGRAVYARNAISGVVRDLDIIKNEAVKFPERKFFAFDNSLNLIKNESTKFIDSKIISLSNSLDVIGNEAKYLAKDGNQKTTSISRNGLGLLTDLSECAFDKLSYSVAVKNNLSKLSQEIISLNNSLNVISNYGNEKLEIKKLRNWNLKQKVVSSPRRSLSTEDCDEQTHDPLQSSIKRLQRGGKNILGKSNQEIISLSNSLNVIQSESAKFTAHKIVTISDSLNSIKNKSHKFTERKIIALSWSLDKLKNNAFLFCDL